MTNQPSFDLLRSEVQRTQHEYDKSKEDFWKISAEVPDERNRIELAARHQTEAMLAYAKALHRFNEFLLIGKVPADLQSKLGTLPQMNQEQQSKMNKCVYCGTPTRMYEHDRPICMDCASRIDAGEKLTKREPTKTEDKTQSAGR